MKHLNVSFAVIAIFAAACATGPRVSTSGGRAAVGVILTNPVFFGSGNTAAANLDVAVENRSAQPIVVRMVRVESSGMAQWGIYPTQRTFRDTLNPGEIKTFPMFATAVTRTSRPTEPLTVRAIVQFRSGEESFQEIFTGLAQQDAY